MRMEKLWLTVGKGGRPGRNITPKGLVIHWTANRSYGANARRNRDYLRIIRKRRWRLITQLMIQK